MVYSDYLRVQYGEQKTFQIEDICNSYSLREITASQAVDQLLALGLSQVDVTRVIGSCNSPTDRAEPDVHPTPATPPAPRPEANFPPAPVPAPVAPAPMLPPSLPPIRIPDVPHPAPADSHLQPIPTIVPTIVNEMPEKLDEARSILAMVKELIDAIAAEIIGGIGNQINQAIQPIMQAQANVIGQLGTQLDRVEATLGRCYDRVTRPIRQLSTEAYGYMMPTGIAYPTNEQIIYGLETGDYLGSVGLQPPSYDTTRNTQTLQNEQATNQSSVVNEQSSPTTINNYNSTIVNEQQPVQQSPVDLINNYIGGTRDVSHTETKSGIEYYPLPTVTETPQLVPPTENRKPLPPTTREPIVDQSDATIGKVPNWDSPTVCHSLGTAEGSASVDNIFGFYIDANNQRHVPHWYWQAWGMDGMKDWGSVKKWGERVAWGILHGGKDILKTALDSVSDVFRCTNIPVDAIFAKIMVGFVNHWTGDSLAPLLKGFDYKLNNACPQEIPSQSDLDKCRLSGTMSQDQWDCLTKANNNLPNLAYQVLFANREKLSYPDALKLYRLGLIDENIYKLYAQWNGYIQDDDIADAEKVAIEIPTVSDLIRMMVKDVADEQVVSDFKLDSEFTDKWKGKLKVWADANGLSEDIARFHWRAHWEYPSNTQAFDMIHRLRPESEFAKRIDAESKAAGGLGAITTVQNIRELLAVNDMAPFWRDRLAAIAYHPMTRTDLQRAYMISSLGKTQDENDDALLSGYQDLGYTLEVSRQLVQFTKALKQQRDNKGAKKPSTKYADAALMIGSIDTEEYIEQIVAFGYKGSEAAQKAAVINANKALQVGIEQSKCVSKSYIEGEIDEQQAIANLMTNGVTADNAAHLIKGVMCKRKVKTREITAAQLCKWRELKLIDFKTHLKRLINLGFSLDDAEIMVQQCETDLAKAAQEKIMKDMRKQQAIADKNAKAAAAAQRRNKKL